MGGSVLLFASVVSKSYFGQSTNRFISLNRLGAVSICVGHSYLEIATVRDAKVTIPIDVTFLNFCSCGFSVCSSTGGAKFQVYFLR